MFLSIRSIFTFTVVVTSVNCKTKKYDLNAECIKVYGEDLKTVVKRFRQTPAYLVILKTKIAAFKTEMSDMMLQEYSWYLNNKLPERVAAKYPLENATTTTTTSTSPADRRINSRRERLIAGYQRKLLKPTGRNTPAASTQQPQGGVALLDQPPKLKDLLLSRRENQAENDVTHSTPTPVQLLDAYDTSVIGGMPVYDINQSRNIGFEAFGDYLHRLIEELSRSDGEAQSTQLPGGGEPTTHAAEHTIGDGETDEETAPPSAGSVEEKKDDTRRLIH